MNKKYTLRYALTVLYGLVVIVPAIVGFIPNTPGTMAFRDPILSSSILGLMTSLCLLVAPFVFSWLYWKKKEKYDLIAAVITGVVFVYILINVLLLARSLRGL